MNVAYAVQLHVLKISEYFSSIAKQRQGSICKENKFDKKFVLFVGVKART